MATAIRVNARDTSSKMDPFQHQDDIQSYLMSNYQEALKKGDRGAAKSCILAMRYFSANDPNTTNEIYSMVKTDSDVSEASKCFSKIFNDLIVSANQKSPRTNPSELSVINQIKNETRVLLTELKFQHLKLKSVPAPAALPSRQGASMNPSPTLSPRLRLSSEDRIASRESITKLDSHLYATTRSFFYQQLFDNLPNDTKRSILNHAIETCDNPYEACRLMMLNLSIFNDSVDAYANRLMRSLIDLSSAKDKLDSTKQTPSTTPRSSLMCRYAKSLLVLDAIPLVLSITSPTNLVVSVDEMLERTLNYYSEYCLETLADEYEANELHEGVRKSITTRILGTEQNSSSEETAIEDNIIATLNLLHQKIFEGYTDASVKEKFEDLRTIITDKKDISAKFDRLLVVIKSLNLSDDIPEEFLFGGKESGAGFQPVVTPPPPKGRGRPKKVQQSVIVSLDDGVKRHLQNKSREVKSVFYSLLQHMFVNCASYLKSTRSRMLMNFDNPLAAQMKLEVAKSCSQRTSRSKTSSQQSNEGSGSASKKLKLDKESTRLGPGPNFESSPLNSEHSKKMDASILATLIEAHECFEFLESNFGAFTKLWQKFLTSNNVAKSHWYRRFTVDGMLLSAKYDKLSEMIDSIFEEVEDEHEAEKTSIVADKSDNSPASVAFLRILTQSISCEVQRLDKTKTYDTIVELLPRMKQCGLLVNDENYSNGNSIDEYLVLVQNEQDENLGFLFFDSLSIMRYCVEILMSIMRQYISSASLVSDALIGHTIVLSQLDWPKHYQDYNQCIRWLRLHKPKSITPQSLSAATKFTYLEFFNYIRNPNIIEDFMALLSQGHTLDIKAPNTCLSVFSTQSQNSTGAKHSNNSSSTRSGKAITTRGVNKTFKEDLKVAMVNQMKGSSVLIPLDVISEFIHTSLIPSLVSAKK